MNSNLQIEKSWVGIKHIRVAQKRLVDDNKQSLAELYSALEITLTSLWLNLISHESSELLSLYGACNKAAIERDLIKNSNNFFDPIGLHKKVEGFFNQKNKDLYPGHEVLLLLLLVKFQHHQRNYLCAIELCSSLSACLASIEKHLNGKSSGTNLRPKLHSILRNWKTLFPYSI